MASLEQNRKKTISIIDEKKTITYSPWMQGRELQAPQMGMVRRKVICIHAIKTDNIKTVNSSLHAPLFTTSSHEYSPEEQIEIAAA